MTLLSYVKTPGFELFVCGDPSREWLEWVRTTTAPLTGSQVMWRTIAQERVDQLGLPVEPRPQAEPEVLPELSAPADNVGLPDDPPPRPLLGRRASKTRQCPHQYLCDQCGQCERCDCYDCPL